MKPSLQDVFLLTILNLVFATTYIFSDSSKIIGFPYRIDAYSYSIVTHTFLSLISQGILPLGSLRIPSLAAGYGVFLVPDPLYAAYSVLLSLANDFVLSYKVLVLCFYIGTGITSYYFVSIFLGNRIARLAGAVAYTFSQNILYEVSLGHLSMLYGVMLLPLIIGFYAQSLRVLRGKYVAASGILLFFLIVEREDYGYMTILLIIIFGTYYGLMAKKNRLPALLSTAGTIVISLLFSYPYLSAQIFSIKAQLVQQASASYASYSPLLIQLVLPVFGATDDYVGDVTILLAVGFAFALYFSAFNGRLSEPPRFFPVFYLGAAIFAILSLGSTTPVYNLLFDYLPSFTEFQAAGGNPTYWLPAAKLCLSVLAGGGAYAVVSYSARFKILSTRGGMKALAALLLILLVLDGGVSFARNETYSPIPGWQPVVALGNGYNLYFGYQTASVPEGSAIYQYLQSHPGNYNVIEVPDLYTRPDYQYLTFLAGTNTVVLNPYGVANQAQIYDEIYNSSNYAVAPLNGNTSTISADLALLGVKFLVYQEFWQGPNVQQGYQSQSSSFKFVLESQNVTLFQNLLYGQNQPIETFIQDANFSSPDNSVYWQQWNTSDSYTAFDASVRHDGLNSLKEVSSGTQSIAARMQYINGSDLAPGTYDISAWDKALNVSSTSDYGIRVSGIYGNGSIITLAFLPFSSGTHDWTYSTGALNLNYAGNMKGLRQLAITTYLRSGKGVAWVNDIGLRRYSEVNVWNGIFAVRNLYAETPPTIASDNLVSSTADLEWRNPVQLYLNVTVRIPCYVILPVSYDSGWSVSSLTTGQQLRGQSYKGLLTIPLVGGDYKLSVHYSPYDSSLSFSLLLYSVGSILVVLVLSFREISRRTSQLFLRTKSLRVGD